MVRKFIAGLILLLGLPLPVIAGQITDIRVVNQSREEIEIVIEGTYGAYQGVGLRSPARFVIDLEGAALTEAVPSSIPVEGVIISEIKIAERGGDVRVVLDSVDREKLFHCTMNDQEDRVVVKCWMPKETKASPETPSMEPLETMVSPALPKKDLSEIFNWPAQGKEEKKKAKEKKLATYRGEKITLDFYKTELHNVFRLFAEMSGKNFIIDDEVQGELTLSLKEVPWDEAMDLVLDLKGLVKEEKLGTTIIKPKPIKEETGKGELVVKTFSEEILQPAKLLKEEKENRGRAQDLIIKAHNLEAMGKKAEALAVYKEAYELWKDNIDLIMKAAYLNYTLGYYARCYYLSGQALKLNSKHAEAALYAALSAAKMKKAAEARQLFEISVDARPQIPEAYYNYALFLKRQKDYAGAISIYKEYEQAFGPSLEIWLATAVLYEKQGSSYEACNQYKAIQNAGFSMDRKIKQLVQEKIRSLCND